MDALKDAKAVEANSDPDLSQQFEKDAQVMPRRELQIPGKGLETQMKRSWTWIVQTWFFSVGIFVFSESEFESYLVASIFQVFFAGFDTSSTILSAFMYFMAKNQEVQKKLFEEVNI